MLSPGAITWDDKNEADHVTKRPIPFAVGALVFLDPDRVERRAKPDKHGAPRFMTVGIVEDVNCAVVFAMRGSTAHIVSVRRASERERSWL